MFSRAKKKKSSNDNSLTYRHNLHQSINNMAFNNLPNKKTFGWSDIVKPNPSTQMAPTQNHFANYSPEPVSTTPSASESSIEDDYSKYLQKLYATDYKGMALNRELEDYTNWNQVDWRYDPVADTINKYGK